MHLATFHQDEWCVFFGYDLDEQNIIVYSLLMETLSSITSMPSISVEGSNTNRVNYLILVLVLVWGFSSFLFVWF